VKTAQRPGPRVGQSARGAGRRSRVLPRYPRRQTCLRVLSARAARIWVRGPEQSLGPNPAGRLGQGTGTTRGRRLRQARLSSSPTRQGWLAPASAVPPSRGAPGSGSGSSWCQRRRPNLRRDGLRAGAGHDPLPTELAPRLAVRVRSAARCALAARRGLRVVRESLTPKTPGRPQRGGGPDAEIGQRGGAVGYAAARRVGWADRV